MSLRKRNELLPLSGVYFSPALASVETARKSMTKFSKTSGKKLAKRRFLCSTVKREKRREKKRKEKEVEENEQKKKNPEVIALAER